MSILKLVGEPTTTTSRWLESHFGGIASEAELVEHFAERYRTSKGTRVKPNNVRSRIWYDILCVRIVRRKQ